MPPSVLITEKEFGKGRSVFESASDINCQSVSPEEPNLASEICRHQAKAVIVGVDKYTGPLYEALAGGLIARFGVGYDGISRDLCRKHQIILTNTPGVLDRSVAEHAVWLMGALARNVVSADRAVRTGRFSSPPGEELFDKTLLLVGFGRIARLVAHIAGFGLGMKVIAFARHTLADQARLNQSSPEQFLTRFSLSQYTTDLEDALPQAGFVSIHLPANEETRHFFDARRLALCKKGSFLINTARGPIVDELALYNALAAGHLAGAALDVFETEPYQPIDPARDLRTLDNIILTPHIGSNTIQANRRMAEAALANCRDFLQGRFDRLTRVW